MAARTTTTQRYQLVSIDKIKPHPRNARQGNIELIRESIEANDFYGACVVQRSSGRIIAGTHRWKAAKKAGYKRVPVIWVDCDDEKALRILLADNRTSDVAKYDYDKLSAVLGELAHDDLVGTGYERKAVTELRAWLRQVEKLRTPPPQDEDWDNIYAINIQCKSEAHMEELYERLAAMRDELGLGPSDIKPIQV